MEKLIRANGVCPHPTLSFRERAFWRLNRLGRLGLMGLPSFIGGEQEGFHDATQADIIEI